jgi:YihY family inner membrane protein
VTAAGSAGEPQHGPVLADRPSLIARVVGRAIALVEPLVARVLGVPRIAMANAVYTRFASSSGPILARGIAFVALFAVVPAVIVILSIVGVFVSDPAVRAEIVEILTEQIPSMAPVLDEALASFSGMAPATGIVGLALLVWSASSLVRAIDGAFRIIFRDSGEGRTPIRDVVSVLAVAAGAFAAAIILILVTLPDFLDEALGLPGRLMRTVTSLAGVVGLLTLMFAFVPRPRPTLRALWLPAVMTGLAVFLLSELFVFLGPLLFGSAELYGAFGALFLGLVWLGNVTQIILVGAAWVAERDRRAQRTRSIQTADGEPAGS